jgi:flavin-dependent dehydrogenase
MGGFGISRYEYDQFLYHKALDSGVHVITGKEVTNIAFREEIFLLSSDGGDMEADLVIGSFGKRSRLDVQWGRSFIKKKSPYVGVKYHILTEHPPDLIALHNFKDGYCGISNIENGKTNLCYLTHRDNLRRYRDIREMEQAVLFRNPFLKSIFVNSSFLFKKPETINEISFETKGPVENHVLLTGDAAGMITPLCGNGMAMAIRSAKILAELSLKFLKNPAFDRLWLEREYARQWRAEFANRLWTGRQFQRLFGKEWTSNLAVNMMIEAPVLARFLVGKTHGDSF